MKILMLIEVDTEGFFEDLSHKDEIDWFQDFVLSAEGQLILHSNEIGDEIGPITKVISSHIVGDPNAQQVFVGNEQLEKVTRVEVIDKSGRVYTNHNIKDLELSLQDDGRTLKLFSK